MKKKVLGLALLAAAFVSFGSVAQDNKTCNNNCTATCNKACDNKCPPNALNSKKKVCAPHSTPISSKASISQTLKKSSSKLFARRT